MWSAPPSASGRPSEAQSRSRLTRRGIRADDKSIGESVTLSKRPTQRLGVAAFAAAALAVLLAWSAAAGEAGARRAPLAGIVRAGGVPVPGASLIVRGVAAGGAAGADVPQRDRDGG